MPVPKQLPLQLPARPPGPVLSAVSGRRMHGGCTKHAQELFSILPGAVDDDVNAEQRGHTNTQRLQYM